MNDPRGKSVENNASGLEHSLTYSERSDHAQALMDVILCRLTAQCRHHVFGETFALADGVLRVWHRAGAWCIDAEICNGGVISRTPRVGDRRRLRPDTEVRANQQKAVLVDR